MNENRSTSWEPVESWYSSCVGAEGHYYHRELIMPAISRLLTLESSSSQSLLDIGCGQGILARAIPSSISYSGIDISKSLITTAKKLTRSPNAQFSVGDVTTSPPFVRRDFDLACAILCLQNMEYPDRAISWVSDSMKSDGLFLIVLNHPCFRIPRQSSWGIDEVQKIQYRRIQRYMSDLSVPIQANPSMKKNSEVTYSFHRPLSDYMRFLSKANFSLIAMEEWCSNKTSTGSKARMENRARVEIPLFCTLLARKNSP